MWLDEAIWGHMLYDEQTPWLIYLEFLNVFLDQRRRGCAFDESKGPNKLRYWAAWRLELRNMLFNSPKLLEIRSSLVDDAVRWREWRRSMARAGGIDQPEFSYVQKRFHGFDDFADIIELLRGTGIEASTNKRWTSKYVFPYGADCVYEDLDHNARTNDRHFFRRSGELLYLMLCRSTKKHELLPLLEKQVILQGGTWNKITALLQPEVSQPEEGRGAYRANAFLPYPFHTSYDEIAIDWIALLRLGMLGYDVLPHLVNLAAFHLLEYQLLVARDVIGISSPLKIVCEVVAPRKTLVREVSCELYQENNLLSTRAITAYIDVIEGSGEWQNARSHPNSFAKCKEILEKRLHWGEDFESTSTPDGLMATLRSDARRRHQQSMAQIHRSYGRAVGLVSKRETNNLRYAPTDDFLRSLLYANVPK
jgi:hypothetical protein